MPEPRSSPRRELLGNLVLTAPFLVLFVVQLVHHQMWRDEVNAFALAKASPNLWTLFHFIHYEGHPWLWYALLWLLSKVTARVAATKLLQGLIGGAIYLVLGLLSPFRRWEKMLLFCGYFIVFEYTVLTRMYGLQLLLALLYVSLRSRRPDAVLTGTLLLGLLACLDLSGLVLSFALVLEYLWSERTRFAPRRRLAAAAAIYAALVLSAALSMLPAHDISRVTTAQTLHQLHDWDRLGASLVNYLATPYLPTVTGVPGHFWGADMEVAPGWFGATVALVLAVYWLTFRRRPGVLLMLGTTSALMIASGFLLYRGSVRHFGITFVAFLCGLWLVRAAGQRIAWPAYVLLAMSAVAGVRATVGSWQRPFSQARATADYLHANHLDAGLIAGYPTATTIGVTEQLGRPLFLVECGTMGTFSLYSRACEDYTPAMLPDRLLTAGTLVRGQSFTFIGEEPLTATEASALAGRGLRVERIGSFAGAEAPREDFFVYQVSSQPR